MTAVAESRVERSDEPSYLVNIDLVTVSRGGGGTSRQGLQNGRARQAGMTRAASAVRGAVVEGLHSSGLAAERDTERKGHRRARGRSESG